jgi:hypothetical protein
MNPIQLFGCVVLILLPVVFLVVGGAILVWGTYRRWALLVNPPDVPSGFYPYAMMKRVLGPRAVRAYKYGLGSVMLALGLLALPVAIPILLECWARDA